MGGHDIDEGPGHGVRARIRRRAQHRPPLVLQGTHPCEVAAGQAGGLGGRSGERRQPGLDVPARKGAQTRDVVALVAGEHNADRWHIHRGQVAAAQDDVDQGPAGASVAVQERVDDLELRMHEAGLDHRGQNVIVDGRAQVLQQAWDVLRRWSHEVGAAGVVVVPADPVLLGAHDAGDVPVRCSGHQRGVDAHQVVECHGVRAGGVVDGEFHRIDVRQDLRHRGSGLAPPLEPCLRTRQVAGVDLHALHLRRRDRLGAQQQPCQRRQRGTGVRIQPVDCGLRIGHHPHQVRRERIIESRQLVGDKRLVMAGPPEPGRRIPGGVVLPRPTHQSAAHIPTSSNGIEWIDA